MSVEELHQLIVRTRGVEEARRHAAFRLAEPAVLAGAIREILENVEPRPGACVMMSALFEGIVRDQLGIPAICVAGDLKVNGSWVFRGSDRLPPLGGMQPAPPGREPRVVEIVWKGHCWIEIDGLVVDISLLRTARKLAPEAVLRRFVEATFGPTRAAFVGAPETLQGLKYRRRFVLTEDQVNGFVSGEIRMIEQRLNRDPA